MGNKGSNISNSSKSNEFSERMEEISGKVDSINDKILNDGDIMNLEDVEASETSIEQFNVELGRIDKKSCDEEALSKLETKLQNTHSEIKSLKKKKEDIKVNLSNIQDEVNMNVKFEGGPITKKEKLVMEETWMKYLIKLDNFGTLSEDLRKIRKNTISHIKNFEEKLDSAMVID